MSKLKIQWRSAIFADLPALVAFCNECEEAIINMRLLTAVRLRQIWTAPGFDVTRSTRIAVTSSGQIVGYAAVFDALNPPVAIGMKLVVHPQMVNEGIGKALLAWAPIVSEARAKEALPRAPIGARVDHME